MNTSELVLTLMEAADQVKVFHWQTESYAEHVALGDLYGAITDTTDKIAESSMGRGEKLKLKESIELSDYAEGACVKYVKALAEELEDKQKQAAPDIANMLQDLLGVVNKTAFLLNLE